jgi:diguanylate cyclase (GGDEF)-like protein
MDENPALPMKLLVVEDGGAGGETLGDSLARVDPGGLEIAGAVSIAEALSKLEHGSFHGTLLDLAVTGNDGLDGLASLRTAAPDVPVIVMAEPGRAQFALDAIRHGAQDSFVRGESSPRAIARMIQNAVERHAIMAELFRSREREHFLATHDSLTGLVNRFEFHQLLRSCLARAIRSREPFAVFFVGLDRFKKVNETLGRRAGDGVLQQVAERLTASIRTSDIVARVGSDEFMVMFPTVTRDHGPARAAQALLQRLAEPYRVAERECWVTASIGVAVFPRDGKKADVLIRNAETAMYAAKAGGANRHHYYAEYMNKVAQERFEEEKRLRTAIEREEFCLHFQPQIDVAAGGIAGAEALLRWRDPDRGLVGPGAIIPIAEETGLIIPIGEWVLRTACEHAVRWSRRRGRDLQLGVNVSSRQLAQKGFAEVVARILDETGLEPSRLDVEITESCILETGGLTMATLKSVRRLGVRISIDDFGTGYSSLVALKHLPVDELKIDRAFVCNLTSDEADSAISKALVAMAKGCGLKAIAEGVETRDQMRFLYANGCSHMQGYLFSKPLPAEVLASHLESEDPPWNAPLEDLPD